MARCGCSDTCNCVITGGAGNVVTGSGSVANPYVVSTPISTDAGNLTTRGSDGWLYTPSGSSGDSGAVTVAGLPATRLVGAWRCGASQGPENTLLAARMAHNAGASLIHFDLRGGAETAGGLFAMADATFDRTTDLEGSTDTPRVQGPFTQWPGHVNPENNAWYGNNYDLDLGTVGDSALWISERVPLLTDFLEAFARRVVLMPHIHRQGVEGIRADLGTMILPYITAYAAQQSVILCADTLDDLAAAVAANVATCLYIGSAAQVATYPPAAVVTAGVGWVQMYADATDAEISSYVAAGLQVLLANHTRHWQADRAAGLSARGVLSADPVYTAKTFNPMINVATTYMNGSYCQEVLPYGTLGELADVGDFSGDTGRGAPTADGYWVMPASIGDATNEYTILMGSYWLGRADPTSWFLQDTISFRSTPTTTGWGFGLFFGLADDRKVMSAGVTQTYVNGYRLHWLYSGAYTLQRVNAGVNTQILSGTWRSGNAVVGTAYSVSLRVSPTAITLYATSAQTQIGTVTDAAFRGPYIHHMTGSAVRDYTGWISPRQLNSPG